MDVAAALSALGFAARAVRTAVDERDHAKISEATKQLNTAFIDAQSTCVDLLQKQAASAEAERAAKSEVHAMHEELAEMRRRLSERERYELVEPRTGTFLLAVKEDSRGVEPHHHLCQPCMDNLGQKSVLQGNQLFVTCPVGKTAYQIEDIPQRPRRKLANSTYLAGRARG